MQNKPELPFLQNEGDEAEIKRYGGYSARMHYEQNKEKRKKRLRTLLQLVLILVLSVFAVFGAVSLIRGDFFRETAPNTSEDSNSIKVPTQQELSQIVWEPEKMLEEVDLSLVTVQLTAADGSRRFGSGFLIAEDYVLCSTTLIDAASSQCDISANTVEGIGYSASVEAVVNELGMALLRLDSSFGNSPVSVGNFSFVERGETLFVCAPSNTKEFPGTALSGIAASTATTFKTDVNGKSTSVPVLFLDIAPNESVWGAPVVDVAGNVIGFCSHVVPSPFGDLIPVVSIHVVYTIVNEILGD